MKDMNVWHWHPDAQAIAGWYLIGIGLAVLLATASLIYGVVAFVRLLWGVGSF